ncbi:MAG TPA: hypothetical protein PK911_05070 [Candidatus Saccharibacteria bacterium]|nr:hypothetical protein [Candidatus Saccharibacteria bacterium]
MGELISMAEYLERKTGPSRQDISKRLAEIAVEQMLLASEKIRLQEQLQKIPSE